MGKRRSMIRKIKYDEASKMNMTKTCENSGVALWSDLNDDVLLLVMMQLGVVDFLAFGGVCKSWRSLAYCNRNRFMASRTPMSIFFSTDANGKECCLEDFEGRKFRTTLPHSADRSCIGVTCGYLILMGVKTNDFWLVHPITRHELYFPETPVTNFCCPESAKCILVFSPSIFGWVLLVVNSCYNNKEIWFSIAGKRKWSKVSTSICIEDLHFFKGKIYALHSNVSLCELRLYPKPKLVLLKTGSFPGSDFTSPGFVSSREKLFVMDRFHVKDRFPKHSYTIFYELDFSELKWMSPEKTGDDYAFFSNEFLRRSYTYRNVTIILQESSVDLCSQYARYLLTDENGKGGLFQAELWYSFHDCLNVNTLKE